MFNLAASKHGLDDLSHLAAKISKLSFDRHCSILIFIGDNYPDDVIGMLFRLVHCDSRGDKPVDDRISKVIRIPQLTENSSQASVHTLLRNALKMMITDARFLCNFPPWRDIRVVRVVKRV